MANREGSSLVAGYSEDVYPRKFDCRQIAKPLTELGLVWGSRLLGAFEDSARSGHFGQAGAAYPTRLERVA